MPPACGPDAGTRHGTLFCAILVAFFLLCPALYAQPKLAPAPAPAPALSPAPLKGLEKLTAKELESLRAGNEIVREVKSASALTMSPFDAEAAAIRKSVADLKPNYLTEVIAIVPYRKDTRQIEKLAATLSDIEGYVGIPYWSARMGKSYDLFDKMKILSRKPSAGGTYIEAEQHMKPFEDYRASYEYRAGQDFLAFRSANLSHIAYKGVRSVAPGGMKWYLYVFPSGDYLVYYGVSAVKAFDMLGLIRDRLETSFVGRVSAFFDYMYAQLKD